MSRATLEGAGPELLSAARWALYAERMVPLVKRAEEVLDMPIEGDAKQRGRIGMAKLHAREAIDVMRPILFPEDDEPNG